MRVVYVRIRQLLASTLGLLVSLLPSRSWRSATFWLIIAVNITLIVLYFWSRGGATTTVRVEAVGSQYKAFVDGRQVAQGTFRGESQGGIGLLLSRNYRLPALPDPNGFDWVRVTDYETGETLFEDDFNGDPSPLWENSRDPWRTEDGVFTTNSPSAITTGVQPWSDVILEASLRNITEATVYVRLQDANNAVVLGIGPFRAFGGAVLGRLENGTAVERVNVARLEVDRGQTLQSMTAMLLRPYPVALLMFAGLTVLAFVVRIQRLERLVQAAGRLAPEMATGIVVGLAGGTFVLLWYLLYIVGDAMPHVPDSVMYVFQSKIFASFNVTADAPPGYPTESFHIFSPHMLQIVEGRWFTHYPFGHPLFLAVGQLVGAVWLIPPLLGAASVAMMYWVGKRIYGVSVGMVAAVLLFSSPFFLMTASNFMSHNTAAFTIIACLFLITLPTRWRLPAMFFAGASLGLLFNIRPLTTVAFVPVLGAFLGYELLRASLPGRLRKLLIGFFILAGLLVVALYLRTEGLPWYIALPIIVPLAGLAVATGFPLARDATRQGQLFREDIAFSAGAALLLGAYFLYNQATTGSFGTNAYEIQGTYTENFVGFGGAHSVSLGVQNQQELLSLMLLVANGWPLAVGLIFAALPFLLGSRNKWDYFLGASFLAIATSPIFYGSAAIMHGPRFWYESLPFLILLTARGAQYLATAASGVADWLAARVQKRDAMSSTAITGLAAYGIIAALVGFSIYGWMFSERAVWGDEDVGVRTFTPASASALEGFNFTDNRLLDIADDDSIDDALVFVENCPQWWCYGSVFWTNSPDLDGDIIWAELQHTPDDLLLLEIYTDREMYIANYSGRSIAPTDAQEIASLVEEQEANDPTPGPVAVTTTPEERDEIRREDLVLIQAVLDQFAEANGTYPNTSGQLQSLCAYRTLDAGCALQDIAAVPQDPLGEPIRNGYWYVSGDGTNYILIALRESDTDAPNDCPDGLFGEDDQVGRHCVMGALP